MPGTTTKYGLRYQLPADPPDGAALGKNLAEDVEAVLNGWFVPLVDQRTAATANITTTTLVTALTVTVPATGTYVFDLLAPFQQMTANGRPGFALGGTSVASAWRWAAITQPATSVTGLHGASGNGTTWPAATAGGALVAGDVAFSTAYAGTQIKGMFTIATAGTVTFRFSQTSGANPVVIREAAMVTVQRTA
jgi:hypothetical protein